MTTPFQQFWTASRTTPLTLRKLGRELASYQPSGQVLDPFTLSSPQWTLSRPQDRLQRLYSRRSRQRRFAGGSLSARQLGSVLSALAVGTGGRRSYPSAGGLYPLRCYPLLLNVRHPLNGKATRYDPDQHALQEVGDCPEWAALVDLVGVSDREQPAPQLALAMVLADEPTLGKYGQRGGRFGLVELGAAVQSVSLRVAQQRLGCYLLGGAADAELLALLGLADQPVRLGGVLLCGRPGRDRLAVRLRPGSAPKP